MGPGPRPYRKNGKMFKCVICGDEFYRKLSFIKRGITNTCGKSLCKSKFFSGENNPAWGRIVTKENRQAVRDSNLSRPKRTGPPSGWTPSPSHRAAVSAALKNRWLLHRDKMIAAITKPKSPFGPRHRREFTPYQKKEWKDSKCAWCDSTDGLELDHIIPIVTGGINIRQNSQTLCRKCNLWKMAYIDRPQFIAMQTSKAASE